MHRDPSQVSVAAPRIGVQLGARSWALIIVSSLVGFFTLAWPLLVPAQQLSSDHAADAPYVFALLLPIMVLLVLAMLSEGGLDARTLAMLGVLAAITAALRPALGAGTAGFEVLFVMLILGGRAFGPGFGYLLGFLAMFASALLTAEVGPWLPFQMMCAAWIGLGAGLLPRARGKLEVVLLIGYGIVSAYAYGLLMNLWFWPFITGISLPGFEGGIGSLDYVAGAPLSQNLVSFLWFTLLTSTASWDTGRAISTSLGLLILGLPILQVLRRVSGQAIVTAKPAKSLPRPETAK